jgi:type I restriction enzyme S subunit
MANWKTYSIEKLIEEKILFIGDGYRAKNSELSSFGIPFARGANINKGFLFEDADRFPYENLARIGNKISHIGDVVFTSKGTVGRFAYVNDAIEQFVYSPQLCFWRVLDKEWIEPLFLFYWMQGREFFLQYSGVKGQTDMADYVSLTDQRRMRITLPPPLEQHAIAEILGSLDDKIELNRRMNETLETMARAIFKSWFVDFDPVHAKARGEQPVGMDEETAALFPDSFEESELGLIPSGWRVGRLDDLLVLKRGFDLPERERIAGDYPIVAASGISGTHNEYKVVAPGVTTGRSGLIGEVFYVQDNFFPLNTSLWVEKFKGATPLYAYHLLKTIDLKTFNSGSAVPSLNRNYVHNLPSVVPSRSVVERFESAVQPMFEKMQQNNEENKILSDIRDTLLPKLVSGEMRVENVNHFMRVNDE